MLQVFAGLSHCGNAARKFVKFGAAAVHMNMRDAYRLTVMDERLKLVQGESKMKHPLLV